MIQYYYGLLEGYGNEGAAEGVVTEMVPVPLPGGFGLLPVVQPPQVFTDGGSRVTADTAFTQDAVLYAQRVLNTVPTPEVVPAPGDQSSDSSDSSESEEPVSTTARSGDAIGG